LSLLHVSLSDAGQINTAALFYSRLRCALSALGDRSLENFVISSRRRPDEQHQQLAEKARCSLDEERVSFWKGWVARNNRGYQLCFRFHLLHERLGEQFTTEFFEACKSWFSGRHSRSATLFNELAAHIAQLPDAISPDQFKTDPRFVYDLLVGFCVSSLRQAHHRGNQLYAKTRQWLRFVAFLEEAVLGTIWCKPIRALPRPKAPPVEGDDTRIHMTDDGIEVRRALLTDVPLELSDGDAKEILFKQIDADLELVRTWARAEVTDAWFRYERRKALAPRGVVSIPGAVGRNTGLHLRLSKAACPEWLDHAAATFESIGFVTASSSSSASSHYPQLLSETTWDLGLPTPRLLLAYGALLVVNHPQITSSFLEYLELADASGNPTGFVATDAGYYLVGFKPRKGADKAQQTIKLNEETTELVRQLILITEPLRVYLKTNGDQTWRRLFLASPSVGSLPKAWSPSKAATNSNVWLTGRFQVKAGLSSQEAYELAKRFSLRSVRASAAVSRYLATGSLQEFAEALGHTNCDPELLNHYLPAPLQAWFNERHIRVFQTGMILLAMEGSPEARTASGFQSMDELDAFLENHALREVPEHLLAPDFPEALVCEKTSATPRIIFGLEVGVLSVLLSVREAVDLDKNGACGRARLWASVCARLVDHIESQTNQPELKICLSEARKKASAESVRGMTNG
jgi:hypothetical protein